MSEIKLLVSDADGTLVNTAPLIRHGQHEAASVFLAEHGVPAEDIPSYDQYEVILNKTVGGSTRQTFERTISVLYEDKKHHLEGIDYDQLNSLLNPIQDRIAPDYVKAFPGLPETLSQIGKMGISLAVFTSGSPHHIVRNFGIALSKELGGYSSLYQDKTIDDQTKLDMFTKRMEEVFELPGLTFVTCDDVKERTKPDQLSAELALSRFCINPNEAVVLGDHAYDIKSGVSAGIVRAIGITHGFDDEALLRDAGATDVISSLPELVPLLAARVT